MEANPTPPLRYLVPTLLAGSVVVMATSAVELAAVVAIVGTGLAITGSARGSRLVLGIGVAGQFVAVVIAALGALQIGLLLVAALGVVLCWDLGEQAINAVWQVGPQSTVTRSVGVHAAGSLLVGIVLFGGIYAGYLLAAGNQPVVALALLLGGGGIVLWGLQV